MKTFGPFYPPLLQRAVNHADRSAHLLSALETRAAPDDEWAWALPTGRASEVERVVEHFARGWRRGDRCEYDAAAALDRYLAVVHAGMRRHLRLAVPACCREALAVTLSPVTEVPPAVARPRYPEAGATVLTVLSIDELLDRLLET